MTATEPGQPDDPQEWLRRARSNLTRARARLPNVYLEDLCFDAQQAAEKAVKAVYLALAMRPPRTHNLGVLLLGVEELGVEVPNDLRAVASLTQYAVIARYPSPRGPVSDEEHRQAVSLAEAMLAWAERTVGDMPAQNG